VIVHHQTHTLSVPYTDDTVMALLVLEACMQETHENDIYISNRLASKIADLFGKLRYSIDPLYDLRAHGNTNIKVGSYLNHLIDYRLHTENLVSHDLCWWTNTDQNTIGYEGGCGSVMRAWPIGLVYRTDKDKIISLAALQSQITHRHPAAQAASAAIAIGVAYACEEFSIDQIVQAMITAASQFEDAELLYKRHAQPYAVVKEQPLTSDFIAGDRLTTSAMIYYAYQAVRNNKQPDEILGTHNNRQANHRSPHGYLLGWAADEAVAAAVYLFVRNSNDVQSAIVQAVNTPGDSDSIAALTGALIGAYTGRVYKTDLSLLENRAYIESLADDIA
jgi:ADP-ribosylglycohydrolase